MRRVFLIHLGQEVFELRIQFVVVEISGEVVETAREPFPEIVIHALPAVRLDVVVDSFSEFIIRQLRARHTYHGKLA